MRVIDHLNLNQLRVFERVYSTGNMTEASRQLGLTQSAVSQHIKRLEESLAVRLFERVNQKLLPTTAATNLYLKCEQGFALLEQSLLEITGSEANLSGAVAVGTPPEFGEAIVIPLVAEFLSIHRGIQIQLKVAPSDELNQLVLRGELAFAFVDAFASDRRLEHQPVYEEVIELCISAELMKSARTPANRKSFYEGLPFVGYAAKDPLLKMWFEHHLKRHDLTLNVRATAPTCKSVARLIMSGVGAGILPSEQILSMGEAGAKLHRFEGCRRPLVNEIHVASLTRGGLSLPAGTLVDWLIGRLREERLAA